jgi:general secretion pathway protein E/type IV pilus assembly protein PilB
MLLGEILVGKGKVSTADVEKALKIQGDTGERIGETLVRMKLCTEEDVLKALSDQTGIPIFDFSDAAIDRTLFREIPSKLVHTRTFLPVGRDNNTLTVAISDPLNLASLDDLRTILGLEIRPVLARERDIQKTMKELFGVGADTVDQMMEEAEDFQVLEDEEDRAGDLELVEDAALIKLVNQIIKEALADRASDIHLEPVEGDLRIRYRIDGVLHQQPMPPGIRRFQSAIISRLKIMANLNIAERRLPQDGRIKLKIGGRNIDVRVSVIPTLMGEGIVLRLLDRAAIAYGLEELGMARDTFGIFKKVIAQPHGIFLVTGPTGSGKTTTLYAALNRINSTERKIITVEDPVEYQLEGINQILVRSKIGLTFARGLRSILRHDPDVIMVGEIRDLETAEIAVQAALTGHLVFSTLHTNDAPQAITRLIDMGVEAFLISSTVEGMMAQRLVRTICSHCREPYEPTEQERAFILAEGADPSPVDILHRGRGCEECRFTGFWGRTGIFEVFRVNDRMRDLINTNPTSHVVRNEARSGGMISLRQDGIRLVREGKTTLEEVIATAKEDEGPPEAGEGA